MSSGTDAEYDKQADIWANLYNRICDVLEQYGTEDSHVPGDYGVVDGYWGYPQAKVSVSNLSLLRPPVISSLQNILLDFSGWEIVVAVTVRGTEKTWPDMGLRIHAHKVDDDLRREYLPPEFKDYRY